MPSCKLTRKRAASSFQITQRLIRLDRPRDYWASLVAAPVFQRLAEKLVVALSIPPDDVRRALAAEGGSISNIQR